MSDKISSSCLERKAFVSSELKGIQHDSHTAYKGIFFHSHLQESAIKKREKSFFGYE